MNKLEQLWNDVLLHQRLEVRLKFGKHWDARALRAKARYAKRKAKRRKA